MLALLRQIPAATEHAREGGWNRDLFKGHELHDKTVGIVGYGRLGHLVARYLLAFGAKVVAADPNVMDSVDSDVPMVPLSELLRVSDIVTVHVNFTEANARMFGAREFAQMKHGAWFINTARGELVEESALLAALRSGWIRGAAIDVVADEQISGATAPVDRICPPQFEFADHSAHRRMHRRIHGEDGAIHGAKATSGLGIGRGGTRIERIELMCGISGIFGQGWSSAELGSMISAQRHRGPDAEDRFIDGSGCAGLGHNRLSIIDLSSAGRQPMSNAAGNLTIAFNGEIYNYLELRAQLSDYPYRTHTDTEVILAAFEKWGEDCVDHFIGMFAFMIWDSGRRRLFAARDRFGVKPLYYHHRQDGALFVASEIGALHAAGVCTNPDASVWSTYFAYGHHDHSEKTFWDQAYSLPAGHTLTWEDGRIKIRCWYDLAAVVGEDYDQRTVEEVEEEYLALLQESVALRFRADVPVGINLSGGLDSSVLLGLVQKIQGADSAVQAFTYVTGDPRYDELPWVQQMLAHTAHPSVVCEFRAEDVPALAASVQTHESEPFGGLPTLAYAKVFEQARAQGVLVLLDGQGMDEQWAGYDYYLSELNSQPASILQGTRQSPLRPECLLQGFRDLAAPLAANRPFPDGLRNRQYQDSRYTKIPRALRFNDRVSMRSSTELREPFLDHRLFELALRQPADRKIVPGERKWMLRKIAKRLVPENLATTPKRPSSDSPARMAGWIAPWLEPGLHRGRARRLRECLAESQGGSGGMVRLFGGRQ